MKRKIYSLLILSVFLLMTAISGCAQQAAESPSADTPADKTAAAIELVSLDGETQQLDLSTLPAVSGKGGFMKSTGTIVGPIELSGPKLSDVLDKVGGLKEDQALKITANDGYEMIFTHSQCTGQVLKYDTEGKPMGIGGLDVIIALESADPAILETPPRIAFIGDGISDGHFWVKDIGKIEVTTAPDDWTLKVSGTQEATVDRSTFESLATCPDTPHPAQTWETTNKKGEKAVYEGVPLWVLVAMADNEEDGHYTFNDELAKQGYTIQVIAKDGFKIELDSLDVMRNEGIFLAYLKNGEPLDSEDGPLQLAGPGLSSTKDMVKQIAEIKLILP